MTKYLRVTQNTINEVITYRVNFFLWRCRMVLQLLTAYFLWLIIIPQGQTLFGYTQASMLTYILLTQVFWSIVMASRAQEIGDNILSGDLSTFLIRPFNYFYYWIARDLGDKLTNIAFSIVEITILILVLKPPLFFQANPLIILVVILATIIGMGINFIISSLLSMIGFWSQDIWAPRFLFYVIMGFFSGTLFPLDIFPKKAFAVLEFLPTTYLVYFPIKVYLGQLSQQQMFFGLCIGIMWIIIGYLILRFIWKKGLKGYGAYGR